MTYGANSFHFHCSEQFVKSKTSQHRLKIYAQTLNKPRNEPQSLWNKWFYSTCTFTGSNRPNTKHVKHQKVPFDQSAQADPLTDLLEYWGGQLAGLAGPLGQDGLQVARVCPQSQDLLSDGSQPLDDGLGHQLLVLACVQAPGLGHRLLHADPGHGGVDCHQVGHAGAPLRVEGHLGGEVGDGATDLEGHVVWRVSDADGGCGLWVGLGHFGRRVAEGFHLSGGG